MSLHSAIQVLFNGLITGLGIALLAVAFQAVYLPTRVFFIGLAGVYALAPFIAWAVVNSGGGWTLAILAALGASAGVSLFSEWASHARLARNRAAEGAHLVASLGIYIILVQIMAMIWGSDVKSLRSGLESTILLGSLIITHSQLITAVVSILWLSLFSVWVRRSNLGLQFRALSDNPIQLALLGYDTDRLRLLAFAVSGLLAGLSSLVTSYDVGFSPHVGLDALLQAIVAVIIGGRDSYWGPALAGVFLGVARAEVVWFFSAWWQDAATFALLLVVLFLRPNGVLGRELRLEAQT